MTQPAAAEHAVVVGRWNPERGREVCANRAIHSGEVLFQSRPFVGALCFENLVTHCSHCFLPLEASPSEAPANRCGEPNTCSLFIGGANVLFHFYDWVTFHCSVLAEPNEYLCQRWNSQIAICCR